MTPHNLFDHLPDAMKHTLDVLSFSLIVGTLFDHLPSIAAGLSIIWSTIRIIETRTVRRLMRRKDSPDNSA